LTVSVLKKSKKCQSSELITSVMDRELQWHSINNDDMPYLHTCSAW